MWSNSNSVSLVLFYFILFLFLTSTFVTSDHGFFTRIVVLKEFSLLAILAT